MSARLILVAAVAAATLGGCGGSPEDAVRAKVNQFADAARAHDYKTICTQVLAPALVAHLTANGLRCDKALRIPLGPVRGATVSIGKVTVHGASASVVALTVAQNQAAAIDTIGLTRTHDGWRISSLRAM
jgi:hypothetical protein